MTLAKSTIGVAGRIATSAFSIGDGLVPIIAQDPVRRA